MIPTTLDELQRIVDEKLEEAIRLEFKRELPPSGQNDDIATDVSAMANTEGGTIIYGIEEQDRRASALRPFNLKGSAERMNLVAGAVDGPVPLGSTVSIPDNAGSGTGFLVVEVLRSERAPHFYKGTACGRSPTGNVRLTRRQIGEMFARQTGFAEEFGLRMGRPGRLMARAVRDEGNYRIAFENDGDADIFDCDWEWIELPSEEQEQGIELPHVFDHQNSFPMTPFAAGAKALVPVHAFMNTATQVRIKTRWRDGPGKEHEQEFPITW